MGNKIIVEFDRRKLLKECRDKQRTIHWTCCEYCKRSNKELIHCLAKIQCSNYEIKEQKNGNKGTM